MAAEDVEASGSAERVRLAKRKPDGITQTQLISVA